MRMSSRREKGPQPIGLPINLKACGEPPSTKIASESKSKMKTHSGTKELSGQCGWMDGWKSAGSRGRVPAATGNDAFGACRAGGRLRCARMLWGCAWAWAVAWALATHCVALGASVGRRIVCAASGASVAGDGACLGVDSGGCRPQNGRGQGQCK